MPTSCSPPPGATGTPAAKPDPPAQRPDGPPPPPRARKSMHRPSSRPSVARPRAALAALLLTGCMAAPLWAADAPLKEEWEPIRSAVAAGAPDAEAQLIAFIAKFPRWPGGYRELARIQWDQRKLDEC